MPSSWESAPRYRNQTMLNNYLEIDLPKGIQVASSSWIAVFAAPGVTGVGRR
jgi:hypothetical protein